MSVVFIDHETPRMRFDRISQAALDAVTEDPALAEVEVVYTFNPHYRVWAGGFEVPAHEFYLPVVTCHGVKEERCIIRIYWNYTNGGTVRWVDFNGLAHYEGNAPRGYRYETHTPGSVAAMVVESLYRYARPPEINT